MLASNISASCGTIVTLLTLTWLGYQSSKPADTPITSTLRMTHNLGILLPLTLLTIIFGTLHWLRLFRASRWHRLLSNAPPGIGVYHFDILSLSDQYILRVLVCLLFGAATLLASYRKDALTPHVALMWAPALLSGSLILNAAYEGRECPVDLELGGG